MEHAEHQKQGFFQRYKGLIILAILIFVVSFFCGFVPFGLPQIQSNLGIPPAARPVIQMPAENLTEHPMFNLFGQDVYFTNTMTAVAAADIVLLLMAIIARIGLKEVPQGFSNLFETLIEFLYNLSEQVVGVKWGSKIFPIAGTIFIFLLVANWMHFIPGFDSVGFLHHAEPGGSGFEKVQLGTSGWYYLNVKDAAGTPVPAGENAEEGNLYVVTPFIRAAATDINVPLGLAVVSFVTIQVFGAMGLRWGYLAKFINTPGLAKGGMGIMDFGVGLFELVLEPVKIISLTFRLLGNIFGGGILLAVVSTLVAFLVPVGLYMFELFVGAIQAYVFAMLTLVFSAMALAGHGGDEHH